MPPRRRVTTRRAEPATAEPDSGLEPAVPEPAEPAEPAVPEPKPKAPKKKRARKATAPRPEPDDDSPVPPKRARTKTAEPAEPEHQPYACGECERVYQEQRPLGEPFLACVCKVCGGPMWFRDGDTFRAYRRTTPGFCNGCRGIPCLGPQRCPWAARPTDDDDNIYD